jgi:hypothetical protein
LSHWRQPSICSNGSLLLLGDGNRRDWQSSSLSYCQRKIPIVFPVQQVLKNQLIQPKIERMLADCAPKMMVHHFYNRLPGA